MKHAIIGLLDFLLFLAVASVLYVVYNVSGEHGTNVQAVATGVAFLSMLCTFAFWIVLSAIYGRLHDIRELLRSDQVNYGLTADVDRRLAVGPLGEAHQWYGPAVGKTGKPV